MGVSSRGCELTAAELALCELVAGVIVDSLFLLASSELDVGDFWLHV